MSFLNNEMLLGDSISPFSQPCSVAEESLGLLDDYLEVAEPLGSHGFSSDKAKAVSSNWLAVDSLGNTIDSSQEDAFSGMEWMVEKMDLKEFDFDALLGMEHLEATVSPDELMATLEDTCVNTSTTSCCVSSESSVSLVLLVLGGGYRVLGTGVCVNVSVDLCPP
uniref:Activating transcription factor 4 n=1 Tax=Taeniopygia guttata TaxID=59729 RepID=A0A674HU12_TAEGU